MKIRVLFEMKISWFEMRIKVLDGVGRFVI